MKKFLLSIMFIVVGFMLVDRVGGMVMWWVNQHTHDVSGPKIKYLVNDAKEDVLLLGTSRCNLHYVPSIIMDTLGASVYNGGVDASDNIYAHYIVLNHVLAVHTPKVICLEVMASDYSKQSNPFNTVSFFAPYLGLNERADSVFRLAGTYWEYHVSHLYRYNAKAVSNIVGLVVNRNVKGDNGYIPYQKPSRYPSSLRYINTPEKVDSMKLSYIQKFINLCRENHVKLVFMASPMYAKVSPDYYDVLKAIAMRNGVPFLDYHTKGLYLDHPEYFRDCDHLWDKGARLYSSIFASDLKHLLGNKESVR